MKRPAKSKKSKTSKKKEKATKRPNTKKKSASKKKTQKRKTSKKAATTKIEKILSSAVKEEAKKSHVHMKDKDSFIDQFKTLFGGDCYIDSRGCVWCRSSSNQPYRLRSCPV